MRIIVSASGSRVICPCNAVGLGKIWSMVVQLAERDMSELMLKAISRKGKGLSGDWEVSPLLLAQPPWAVSTFKVGTYLP